MWELAWIREFAVDDLQALALDLGIFAVAQGRTWERSKQIMKTS